MPNNINIKLLLAFNKAPEDAVKYLQSLGIKITWNWQEQLQAIKNKSFTVSKITNADLLQAIHNHLVNALNNGTPFDDFKLKLDDMLLNMGYLTKDDGSHWRLDTIYRTNLQSAYMAGRYAQQQEVVNEFPFWEYSSIIDNRTTDSCRSLNGVILPANNPFWKTNYPPRHYNCRARVVAHNKDTLSLYNKKISNPKLYANVKPSTGFDTVPGGWMPDMSKYTPQIKSALNKVIRET